jgi:GGDEF domain-containing protein
MHVSLSIGIAVKTERDKKAYQNLYEEADQLFYPIGKSVTRVKLL